MGSAYTPGTDEIHCHPYVYKQRNFHKKQQFSLLTKPKKHNISPTSN